MGVHSTPSRPPAATTLPTRWEPKPQKNMLRNVCHPTSGVPRPLSPRLQTYGAQPACENAFLFARKALKAPIREDRNNQQCHLIVLGDPALCCHQIFKARPHLCDDGLNVGLCRKSVASPCSPLFPKPCFKDVRRKGSIFQSSVASQGWNKIKPLRIITSVIGHSKQGLKVQGRAGVTQQTPEHFFLVPPARPCTLRPCFEWPITNVMILSGFILFRPWLATLD